MKTPICDFVREYIAGGSTRFHMPGHKGASYLGCEAMDITEIVGADSLYEADGIIRESERNAGSLFGAQTYYSAEGSSHAIRAMLYLACRHARQQGKAPCIWAARNVHSTFLSAAALLDFQLEWLYAAGEDTYLSCRIGSEELAEKLNAADSLPTAVYVTSPDYLGNQCDIQALAQVCHRNGVLLVVDNAHGAYLKFLPESRHPMDLGADLCCDSAHKTLPVLTGGAYLHINRHCDHFSEKAVRNAFRLFGSTSPSYLILQSLDLANPYLESVFPDQLRSLVPLLDEMKAKLTAHGYTLLGSEPLKLTISAKPYGYTGGELAERLARENMVVEFFDPDYVVFMFTPSLPEVQICRLTEVLLALPRKEAIQSQPPQAFRPETKLTVRQAMLSPFESLPVAQCLGRTLAQASVGCPPAVPILVTGEVIDEQAVACFRYYGIETCDVVL